jgi:hypothetical protein
MSEAFAGPVPGSPVPASAIERLTLIANDVVEANGGVAPAWVSVVVTTQGEALTSATPGHTVVGDMQAIVYLMTMEEQFVARRAPRPPRAKAPTGTYLSIVLDAQTFRRTAFGLGPNPPPVAPASLGPVTYLER